MKLGSSRGMDTKRPRGSERSKPCHELQLTRRSQPPYPWPPEQAQPGVSKPCRTTVSADLNYLCFSSSSSTVVVLDSQERDELGCRNSQGAPLCVERRGIRPCGRPRRDGRSGRTRPRLSGAVRRFRADQQPQTQFVALPSVGCLNPARRGPETETPEGSS